MSASRPMSRVLRASTHCLPRSTLTTAHPVSFFRPASSLRPAARLAPSSLTTACPARRSFFSRTNTSADSQQQSTASSSQSAEQSTSASASTSSSSSAANSNGQPSAASSNPAGTPTSATNGQPSSASSSSTASPSADTSALQQQLTAATAQQKETYDRLLRTAADMENLRRTTRLDVDNARKYAVTGFAKSLLEVADTLELAGKSAREALAGGGLAGGAEAAKAREVVASLVEGVEMTERVLGKVLADNGITRQDALGVKFNPHEHHGLFEVEGEAGQEAGTIAHVMKNGYKIHDRILRAAQVGTVKAKKA